jgi:RND family efflux transporter MFP subunit
VKQGQTIMRDGSLMDRFARIMTGMALPLASGVFSGCSSHSHAQQASGPLVVPATRVVQRDLSNSVTLTAEFEPFYEVDVMAKEAGYVRHMLVDIGDRVKKGQLLATLEIPELRADLTKSKSEVQTALDEKAVSQGDVRRATAADQIAELSYNRIMDVSKKEPGLVPMQEVDLAHSHALEAEAQVSSAQQRVQASESRYQSAIADTAHEAALVDYTRIVAPFDGVVTQRYASDGAMIQAGTASQTQAMPIVKVSQNNVLRLMLPVPEDSVTSVHNGQTVTVNVPALHRTFEGTVTRFADRLQMSTRTMTAEVDVKNPQLQLIPGMYAKVKLDTADAKDAVVVPPDAIDGIGDNQKVFVLDNNGILHSRKIHTGLQTPQFIQVLSGLGEGEVVVTGRFSDLRDGESVKPRFEDSLPSASPAS